MSLVKVAIGHLRNTHQDCKRLGVMNQDNIINELNELLEFIEFQEVNKLNELLNNEI